MRTLILVLGWLSVAGSVLGGLVYASAGGVLLGLVYLVVGVVISVPFFGLAGTMKLLEELTDEVGSLRAEVNALQRSQRTEKAPLATPTSNAAPLASGARKLEAPQTAPQIDTPKIDLSAIKESDNR